MKQKTKEKEKDIKILFFFPLKRPMKCINEKRDVTTNTEEMERIIAMDLNS